jgi:hypothetical protein
MIRMCGSAVAWLVWGGMLSCGSFLLGSLQGFSYESLTAMVLGTQSWLGRVICWCDGPRVGLRGEGQPRAL